MSESFANALGQRIGAPLVAFSGSRFPKRRSLEGRYSRLCPLDPEAHAAPLFEQLCHEGEHWRWTYADYGPFTALDDWKKWLEEVNARQDAVPFVVHFRGETTPSGLASFARVDPSRGSLALDLLQFTSRLRRTREATEAVRLMLSYAFDELGFRRCEFRCDALDERTRAFALRLGFQVEGVLRQERVCKGRNRDTAIYALLDCEWPAVDAALTAWLAPNNFDEHGGQRTRLSEATSQSTQPVAPSTVRYWETR